MKIQIALNPYNQDVEEMLQKEFFTDMTGCKVHPENLAKALESVLYHGYSKITATMDTFHNSKNNVITYFCEKPD